MDRPRIEITYVYPNRYLYWTTRHTLTQPDQTAACDVSTLGRKLVLHVPKSEEDEQLAQEFEEILCGDDNELKSILTQCLNSLSQCPSCEQNKWHIVYDDYATQDPIIKICQTDYCNFAFGFDDSFSIENVVSRLNQLHIKPGMNNLYDKQEIAKEIEDVCKLDCPCGNGDLNAFFVVEESQKYLITCEQCGRVLKLKKEKTKKREETPVDSVDMLKRGDHILWVKSLIYEHHAIVAKVLEDDQILVYQCTPETKPDQSKDPNKCKAKKYRNCVNMEVRELFNKDQEPVYRVEYNNPTDERIVLQRAEEIVIEADVNQTSYSLLFRNCEQFARYCKTGEPGSLQWHRVRQVFAVIIGKTVVKGVKEFAHFHGFKLISRLAVKSGTSTISTATKFGRFLKSLVNTKLPGLTTNAIAFGIMVAIELVFFFSDIYNKRKDGMKGEAFRTFLKWRTAELGARLGASGIAFGLSILVSALLINFAVNFAILFCIQAVVMVILTAILLAVATWLVKCVKRKFDQHKQVKLKN